MNHELFRFQALKGVGLLDHPKADWAYAQAWEYGWQGGLHEVLHCLADIAEMILEGV